MMTNKLQEASSGPARKRGVFDVFSGRGRRREYFLIMVPVFVFATIFAAAPFVNLLIALPSLLAMIRRFHDLGLTGWLTPLMNIAIGVLSFGLTTVMGPNGEVIAGVIAIVALLVLGAIPGQPHTNLFGPPPGGRSKEDLSETFG